MANNLPLTLSITVRPGAQRTRRKPDAADGTWRIDIAAPPEGGAANRELMRFMSEILDVPLSRLHIVSGLTARKKRVQIVPAESQR